ncbi:hypothetical protein ACTFIR_003943 [Dictyostelium discoideum]
MSTTVNNNDASSSTFTRFMKEPMFSSNTNSRSQRTHDDSDTDDESSNNVDVPTDYQLSDTLLVSLLVEEECILKKDEISELNKVFNFPSNFQVYVAPFGTPEGITVSSTVKNNDTDLLIVEKRINDSLKPLLLMSSMISSDSSNVDVELISYLAQSAIVLAVNAQASLSRVRGNNFAKEIYGSEILLPIKIKDTPKMFNETETERVRKLAKSIRKNNEAKQSLLKLNYHSKSNTKKSINSSGNNTTGNSSNNKSSSGSNGRSNNFNGSPSNVASGSNNTKLANEEQEVNLPVGGRLFHHKQVWKELGLPNYCQEVVNGLKVHLLPNFKPMPNPIPFSIPEGPKSDCITKEVQDLLLDDAIEQVLPNRYSKRVFYSNVFTVPKPGTNLHRPVLDLKRLNTYINNQSFKMEGIKNLPTMVKQGYYMVKLDIKKAYLHVLVDPQYRDLFRFVSSYLYNAVKTCTSNVERYQPEDSNRQHNHSLIHQPTGWSDTGPICSVRTTLETMPQEESELDWRAYSRILQCKSRPPQPSFRDESQIVVQSNQELQLATEEGSVQSHPTSVRSNTDGSVRISPEPSNFQLLNNQNECTPPRLESMEAMSGLPTTHSFAFYPGEDELIQFEEGFYNTDLPNLEISNLVSDDSSSSSSSSSSHVSSSTGNIPRSIDKTISRVNTNPNSTTLETGDYSTFQSHVMSIIRIQKSSTAELLMKSWEPSTLKVYSSSYTRFRNFCSSNSLNPANITLVVFMDYLTHLFKHKPPLAFSTINGHRSMLNQLLLLKNQTDIVNDPFITRIMTGIHKLRPSSAKYQEIWDANQVFKHLSTIKVIPKYTYTALLKKTLVLCKMFGLARSSDLVKWSFNGLNITPDSIKGPVVNAKEQRKGVLSILELTSLDDTNSQVCPVRHLSTYLRASKGRRKPHSGDSVFIQNEGKPLDVKEINIIVLSTLSSSGIDISKFKSHSTRSAMASLLLSNNVPFHVVKKMGRWKSNDTVDTFYDKRIIGEKSGGFLNTVVQIS